MASTQKAKIYTLLTPTVKLPATGILYRHMLKKILTFC